MIKKSLIPEVLEDGVDLSLIDLTQYERCPLCGKKLKCVVSAEKIAANRLNLKKRKSKGGRPKKEESK